MAESPDIRARLTHPLAPASALIDNVPVSPQSPNTALERVGDDALGHSVGNGAAGGAVGEVRALAAARAGTQAAVARLVRRAVGADESVSAPLGEEHLLVTCAGVVCAVALAHLREVLPTLPTATALPFSPSWLLGVFPLRTELVALVDPAPTVRDVPQVEAETTARRLAAVLVAGAGEQSLGLAVAAVGDIAVVREEEIVRDTSGLGGGVRPAYVAGWYTPAGGRPAVLLDVPRLVADLLRALSEESVDG